MRYGEILDKAYEKVYIELQKELPSNGYLMAYTRKQVIFCKYGDLSELDTKLKGLDILELHLFDDQKEYRWVVSQSARSPEHYVDHFADFTEDDDTFVQNIVPENKFLAETREIVVVNHISYSETGMAYIDDYRLKARGGLSR